MTLRKEFDNIAKKDPSKFEEVKKKRESKERHFNNALKIPFMKAEGAYHILAKVLELEHHKEGMFEDKQGNMFVLTKYGFQDSVQYNLKYENMKLEKSLQNHTASRLANFEKMKEEITSLQNKLKEKNTISAKVLDILDTEDNLYKQIELIRELLDDEE